MVIGVHAPEFSFEKNIDNIRWAVKDMRIQYPIVIDNDHEIWRAFNNEYWPALYFADEQGHIRHQVFGEGQYQQSEAVIQRLLAKAGKSGIPGGAGFGRCSRRRSRRRLERTGFGENYVGYGRTENFASPGGAKADKAHVYAAPGHAETQRLGSFGRLDDG